MGSLYTESILELTLLPSPRDNYKRDADDEQRRAEVWHSDICSSLQIQNRDDGCGHDENKSDYSKRLG